MPGSGGGGGSEDVDSQIKAQLEDDVIREALTSGTDLRQYSQSVEKELRQVRHRLETPWPIFEPHFHMTGISVQNVKSLQQHLKPVICCAYSMPL